ncbi:MAG: hypothetical protein CL886_05655 [Dehalococcoidia bacterium]|nr:hypothetical protein [Dehalococcoidia bacterium]
MAIFLRDTEVSETLSMAQMIEKIESMQSYYGNGEASNLPRRKLIASSGMLAVMGGGLFYEGVLGVKTYTVVKGQYSFQVSLYDAETGKLLCYTQANRLGQLRTGATSAVAAKYLTDNSDITVGIIGTGYQAATQLEALSIVRNITNIRAFSRTESSRKLFAENMSNALQVPVRAAESAEETVRNSDIVICIAATMDPVINGDWLSDGSTIIAAGPTTWRAKEVDISAIKRADKIIVDSAEQAPMESGDLSNAVDQGIVQLSQLIELRHVVSGKQPGRDNNNQIIYAKLMGTGVADVAAAKLAYDTAKRLGIGTDMEW